MYIVFGFLLVLAVGLSVFYSVVFACSFDLFFGCVLFLSVLFLVSFHFAFPCLYLSCLLLIVLYRWYPFRNMTAKSAAALRCRLLPVPIDYWFDIGPIAVWNGNGPARRNRMNEPEELQTSDGSEHGPFPPEDQFVLEPWRPFTGPFDLLNRYRDQSAHLRYRIRWMKVSDIGALWSTSCRWIV